MSEHDRETQAIFRATQRVAQRQARLLLREMRVAVREKAKARRVSRQRLLALGTAVVNAGCGDWQEEELTGALSEVLEHVGRSPAMRARLRKSAEKRLQRGQQNDCPSEPADEGPRSPRAWEVWPQEDSS